MALDDPQFVAKMMESRQHAYETSAVVSLRSLNNALVSYSMTYPEEGFPAEVSALGPPPGLSPVSAQAADLVDAILACSTPPCVKNGYRFTYRRTGTASPGERYTITAQPMKYGLTGTRSFFTDETFVIRFTSEDRTATANDPPLQ